MHDDVRHDPLFLYGEKVEDRLKMHYQQYVDKHATPPAWISIDEYSFRALQIYLIGTDRLGHNQLVYHYRGIALVLLPVQSRLYGARNDELPTDNFNITGTWIYG